MLIRLQKELFVGDEHLLAMCHCFKITKEKKAQTKRKRSIYAFSIRRRAMLNNL